MPDDRFFHKRLGHSAKVNSLTDFEFRVWAQYELSADDCGVLRYNAVTLQADNDSLATRSAKSVQRALDRIVLVGLLLPFDHQGQRFVCQVDWQNFQRVRYPRPTIHPCPPSDVLAQCTPETVGLFRVRHGVCSASAPETSGEPTEPAPAPTRAGGRERLTAMAKGNGSGGLGEKTARMAFGGKVLEVPKFLDEEFVRRLNGQCFELTEFYQSLDTRLSQTGETWDLRWIRDRFSEASPVPERRRVERESDDRPISSKERADAERIRRHSWGSRCQHEPKCENAGSCIARLVRDRRSTEAA